MNTSHNTFLVATLYKFTSLSNPTDLQMSLTEECGKHQIKGLVILAGEGINGTIAGTESSVRAILRFLRTHPDLMDLTHTESRTDDLDPMERMKVVIRDEIVTMGIDDIEPREWAGEYVEPGQWNQLIADDNVCLIDTRNAYEIHIGSFQGALDPKTTSFREFPTWVAENRSFLQQYSKIAMFCTGGIRCEKATAYLKQTGFESVYHLKGGILKYLETMPAEESAWRGQCFVFDKRVSVGHGLDPGDYTRCRGCRHPITSAEQEALEYEEGVSCPHCFEQTTADQKRRFRERRKQIDLAAKRGETHLGTNSQFQKKGS